MAKTENRLSRETVADGALALADAEGFEALTIRRLAQDLGVTPMALYWHFKNKDELIYGVVDRMWTQVDCTRDRSKPLLEQFRALVVSLVRVLREHRSMVPMLHLAKGAEPGQGFLDATEAALEILLEIGFDVPSAASICQNALRTATTLVLGEQGVADPRETPEEAAETTRRKRLALESLPRSRYPRIVQAAGPLTTCADPVMHYEFGLDLFLAGIAALTPQSAAAVSVPTT